MLEVAEWLINIVTAQGIPESLKRKHFGLRTSMVRGHPNLCPFKPVVSAEEALAQLGWTGKEHCLRGLYPAAWLRKDEADGKKQHRRSLCPTSGHQADEMGGQELFSRGLWLRRAKGV